MNPYTGNIILAKYIKKQFSMTSFNKMRLMVVVVWLLYQVQFSEIDIRMSTVNHTALIVSDIPDKLPTFQLTEND